MISLNLVFPEWEGQVEARKSFRSVVRHKADRFYPEFQPEIPPTPDIQASFAAL